MTLDPCFAVKVVQPNEVGDVRAFRESRVLSMESIRVLSERNSTSRRSGGRAMELHYRHSF